MDSHPREDFSHSTHTRENRDQEPQIVIFDDDDVQEGVKECEKSVIGKIITKKIFQFFFQERRDVDRVIKGSPWLFRNSWLILEKWQRGLDPMEISFKRVPIWIQLWGLPLHCRSKKMGIKIGECMGPVNDANLYEIQGRGSFVKVHVHLDIDKPLLHGVNVGSKKDGVFWVDFQYERLPQFCYSCGLIGHDESTCEAKEGAIDEERKFGPWLKASHFGRRILTEQDHPGRDKEEVGAGSSGRRKASCERNPGPSDSINYGG
ncbi:Zinc knuckle CX2CX4HX4C [Sesbania bispinosa]|nr:Zinc knuckle CX2CX4HX4C [Sesbania bispinosa]